MKKGRYIASLILNVLTVAAIAFAVVNAVFEFFPMNEIYAGCMIGKNGTKIDYLFEFGVLAGIFGGIVALINAISDIVCLAKKKPTSKFVSIIKMVSASVAFAAAFKFFVIDSFGYSYFASKTASYETANYDLYRSFLLDWHWPLFISVVAPALIIVDYVFFELDPKVKFVNVLWALIPGVVYFGFVAAYDFLVVATGKGSFPDSFVFTIFNFHKISHWRYIAIVVGGGTIGFVLAAAFFFLLRALVRKCALKEKVAVEAPAKLEDVATKEEQPIKDEPADDLASSEETKHDEGNEVIADSPVEERPTVVASEKPETTEPVANTSKTPSKTTAATTTKAEATATTVTRKKTGKKVIILKTESDKARAEGIDIRIDTGDEEAEEAAERKAESKSTYKTTPRVYHISKQASGKWQVKLATGERAIKLFDTQQQAIIYAKSLVRTQGGSIRIHAVSGKMRKE